jgi:SWIM zinc finger
MQQLKVEHKKEKEITKDRRESKSRVLAISRRMYRLLNSDVYYVESESSDNIYYFVKFKPDVFEWCSCKDFELNRAIKCKHLYAIEFAIRMGTLKDIDKLPADAKRYNCGSAVVVVTAPATKESKSSSSYRDDDYSF